MWTAHFDLPLQAYATRQISSRFKELIPTDVKRSNDMDTSMPVRPKSPVNFC